MIRSLRKKFILVNMLLVFSVLAAVFVTLCVTTYNRQVSDSKMALGMTLERRGDQRPPTFKVGQSPPQDFNRDPVLLLLVQDGQTRILREENLSATQEEAAEIAAAALATGKAEGVLPAYNLRFLMRTEQSATRIALVDTYRERRALQNTLLASSLALAGAMAAFFLISLFLSRWALRPVEAAWEQQRRFVADASHELKTPLTVILANMGILLANPQDTVEQQAAWVESTGAEATRMKHLVDELLFLAKADDAKPPLAMGKLNLSDLVTGMALTFESVAYERGLLIETRVAEGVYVVGDASQLTRLVSTLADNALKYAARGSTVTIALALRQGKAMLSVHNLGQPLSPREMSHLFQRFYRADPSRSTEGYGLGLAIAKSIVEQHKGKIWAESGEGGTTFTAALPAQ